MRVIHHENFTHTLIFSSRSKIFKITLRDLEPRDFYWIASTESQETEFMFGLIERLSVTEFSIGSMPIQIYSRLSKWIKEEILKENLMEVETWLFHAYHLMNRTWGSNLDYLERQPMPKINMMIKIQSDFIKSQVDRNKNGSKN